jgi:hypothetical protein
MEVTPKAESPLVKKYKSFGEEGYGFIYIKNDEESATFKEECNFTKFQGLKLMKPQFQQSYDIIVPPKSDKLVLIRCSPEGYSLSMSLTTSVVQGGTKLRELTKSEGTVKERLDTDTN